MKTFRGTYTVPITPFTADGKKVDEAALRRLVDFQIEEGIHGLIPLGSTGEFLSVTPDERRQIVEIVIGPAAGHVPVLIGTGAEGTEEVVRASREAEAMGADGVMIIPPFYSVPTDDELYAHCKRVSDAISLPIMVYNNPAAANVDMMPELIARLAQIPNCRNRRSIPRACAAEAITVIRKGLAHSRTVAKIWQSYGRCFIAEALAREGNYQAAHAAVTQALDDIRATGERMWHPEVHRVHGLVLLNENKPAESEAAFLQALDLAQQQQAKSLELRAATSLARLWGEQRRRAEAREPLAPVYG